MQKHKNSTNDSLDDWNSVLVREKKQKKQSTKNGAYTVQQTKELTATG